MPKYEVNQDGVNQARKLIDDGRVDTSTEWSTAAPSTDEENRRIETEGYEAYGRWHLATDTEASEETKARYRFPYGDFSMVSRAGLIHAKQRAAQNGHDDIEKAADELLQRVDARDR